MQNVGFLTKRLIYLQVVDIGTETKKMNICHKKPWLLNFTSEIELCREKTNILVSDQVRHKPGCTATEDGQRLEISDLESRGIVLSMQRKQRH